MANDELNETLATVGKHPETFRRDTPLIFRRLDQLQKIERDLQRAIYGVDEQIAYDEGADITDGASDDEK